MTSSSKILRLRQLTNELWHLLIGGNALSPIAGIGIGKDRIYIYLAEESEGKVLLKRNGIGVEYKGVPVKVEVTGRITI